MEITIIGPFFFIYVYVLGSLFKNLTGFLFHLIEFIFRSFGSDIVKFYLHLLYCFSLHGVDWSIIMIFKFIVWIGQ